MATTGILPLRAGGLRLNAYGLVVERQTIGFYPGRMDSMEADQLTA